MDIHQSWPTEIARIPAVRFEPIDTAIAVQSTQLPGAFHRDPADRLIVALARAHSVPLITADNKLLTYEHVTTLW